MSSRSIVFTCFCVMITKLYPATPVQNGYKKRRGSHTLAYPEHWPWRAIERDKQRSQPTSGMIMQYLPHRMCGD